MVRLPRITGAQMLRAIQRAGWRVDRQRGSHVRLTHPDLPGQVTIPVHAGEILAPKTLLSILEQAGISVDELRELL
jgi:predicted RNA binding protein YcfA (HicA-like mRNA interferase family)